MGAAGTVPETVWLDMITGIEPEATPGGVSALVVGPDMGMICDEGGSESDEPGEELV